jgi:sialic acid synthase SpsE/sugar phosphate isomerase/epimerase
MQIGKFRVDGKRTFVIAEIGNNHNGSFERAIEMVDRAIEMGADCAKFQMRQLDQVYRKRSLNKSGEDLGTEYIIDLLNRFELSVDEQRNLAAYCKEKNILYLCTPWDIKSVDVLESFSVEAYKVASADLTNLPLLDKLVSTKKPLILSTGMSTPAEVQVTVNFLNKRKAQYVLLHCNSTYPAPFHDINLLWINSLKKIHPLIGYSGHERGISVSMAAVTLGACIIERHFTLDRTMEGPDHAASLEYSEFQQLITGIREIEQALGDGTNRQLSQGEMINRENLGKSLVAATALKVGTILQPEHIKVLSPGQGLAPHLYEELLGKELKRDMLTEDFFFQSDIDSKVIKPRPYTFKHPWGIPVRYHDFTKYHRIINPDFYEFHLSYSDMDLNPADYLQGEYDCGFVVHAPELFEGSHLMDLATPDAAYRAYSMEQTQRVIDITRSLKKFFPKEKRPMIVANIGGFSMDKPIPKNETTAYYEQFAKSLQALDTEGVEIIPQTMAPFPWHFGGQRYQNIFVEIEEIEHYCKKFGIRMCFDVSHSMLGCNHMGKDFYDFARRMAPFTGHLHLGDAKGVNGEGLQIGEGDMDFKRLGKILNDGCPNAYFIPEIWQGHKNEGSGFWFALEKLESIL